MYLSSLSLHYVNDIKIAPTKQLDVSGGHVTVIQVNTDAGYIEIKLFSNTEIKISTVADARDLL